MIPKDKALDLLKSICISATCTNSVSNNIAKDYWKWENEAKGNSFLALIKSVNRASEEEKLRDKVANDLFSSSVSSIRESVKAFFNWLNGTTNIQRAYRYRSATGLFIHDTNDG